MDSRNNLLLGLFGDAEDSENEEFFQASQDGSQTDDVPDEPMETSAPQDFSVRDETEYALDQINLSLKAFKKPSSHATHKITHLGAFLGIQSEAFDPSTYDGSDMRNLERINEYGEKEVRSAPSHMIRWRRKIDASGTSVVESNSKFVKWSDGSVCLYVGSSCFLITEKTLGNTHWLVTKSDKCFEAQALINEKIIMYPSNTVSPPSIKNESQISHKALLLTTEQFEELSEISNNKMTLQQNDPSASLKNNSQMTSSFLEHGLQPKTKNSKKATREKDSDMLKFNRNKNQLQQDDTDDFGYQKDGFVVTSDEEDSEVDYDSDI